MVVRIFGPALEESDLLAFGTCMAAALAVAMLLYVAVERPSLRLRDHVETARRLNDRTLNGRPVSAQP